MTRLSPTDHSFLTYQAAHPGVSVEIGQILLFGGRPPSVGELRAHLAPRLDLLPALRRTPRPGWRWCGAPDGRAIARSTWYGTSASAGLRRVLCTRQWTRC